MLIVICGKSGSGKTTTAKEMEKYGFKKLVTDTSRPMRPGEVNGVDYNFRSDQEFLDLMRKGRYAETVSYDTVYGTWRYGSLKEFYEGSKEDQVIVLNPIGLKQVINTVKEGNYKSVYLDINEDLILKRLKLRGDNAKEVARRLEADRIDFKDIEEYTDFQVKVEEKDTVEEIAKTILRRIKKEEIIWNLFFASPKIMDFG